MLANVFTDGVSMYAFYAMQPYLLQLYGDPRAYGVAGIAAAVVGGAQIGGGLLVPHLDAVFRRRTSVLVTAALLSTFTLAAIAAVPQFWTTVALLSLWGLVFATVMPVRQAYVNELIPSEQRATVLSFDSLMGSTGGVFAQPLLGKSADAWGYGASYGCSAIIQALAIPFMVMARRENVESDDIAAEQTAPRARSRRR